EVGLELPNAPHHLLSVGEEAVEDAELVEALRGRGLKGAVFVDRENLGARAVGGRGAHVRVMTPRRSISMSDARTSSSGTSRWALSFCGGTCSSHSARARRVSRLEATRRYRSYSSGSGAANFAVFNFSSITLRSRRVTAASASVSASSKSGRSSFSCPSI